MAKARRSGIVVTPEMVPLIFGMLARGDRNHDVAAWFGLNQGRMKETKDGDYGRPAPAPEDELPPAGSPGPRALRLRDAVETAIEILTSKTPDAETRAIDCLQQAVDRFNEPR